MHGRHKSLDKELKKSLMWLQKVDAVSKIILGFSECCRHKYPPGYLKIRSKTERGLRVNGYSGKGVTEVFVKVDPISELEQVAAAILFKFK